LVLFAVFFQENGDRRYDCGVTINVAQQTLLDDISKRETGDGRFVGSLLDICFSAEVLARASITGKSKKDINDVAKLDPQKMHFIKSQYQDRLANAADKEKREKLFNIFVNRKVQNSRRKFMTRNS
jgi:BEN domain